MAKKSEDWRKKPRKPEASKRNLTLTIRLSKTEKEKITKNAEKAGMTITDYIVSKTQK